MIFFVGLDVQDISNCIANKVAVRTRIRNETHWLLICISKATQRSNIPMEEVINFAMTQVNFEVKRNELIPHYHLQNPARSQMSFRTSKYIVYCMLIWSRNCRLSSISFGKSVGSSGSSTSARSCPCKCCVGVVKFGPGSRIHMLVMFASVE